MLEYAKETRLADGRRVLDEEWVQVNLAKVYAGTEFLRLPTGRSRPRRRRAPCTRPTPPPKVFGTEFYLDGFQLLMEVVGPRAYLTRGSPEAVAQPPRGASGAR